MPIKNPPLTVFEQNYIETHYQEIGQREIARNLHISLERVSAHLREKGLIQKREPKGTRHHRKPDKIPPHCFNWTKYTNWLVG